MQKLAAMLANNIAIMTHILPKYTGLLSLSPSHPENNA
jgi:hypothetical protein